MAFTTRYKLLLKLQDHSNDITMSLIIPNSVDYINLVISNFVLVSTVIHNNRFF